MKYPLYVHHEPGMAYGGTFPDLPGVFTAADTFDDLPRLAQEAVEVAFHGEDAEIPAPTDPFQWADHADFQGGVWLLVDLDLTKVNSKAVRLNISLPANLVQQIDRYAEANGMTRSGFLAAASVQALPRALPPVTALGISVPIYENPLSKARARAARHLMVEAARRHNLKQ